MPATRSFGLFLLGLGFTLGFRSTEARRDPLSSPCQAERFAGDPPAFGNCSVCHADSAANAGDGLFRISGVPETWIPGTTYRLTAVLADPGQRLWGFRATAIDAGDGDAGILQPSDSATAACILDANGRSYIRNVERFPGVPDGPVQWEFDWTAPQSGTGRVFFYGAALAADRDGTDGGDFTYTDATASLEGSAGIPPVSLILQPDGVSVAGGSSLVIHARVRNHSAVSRTVTYSGRIGNPFGLPISRPADGPFLLQLAPGEQKDLVLLHPVPLGTPVAASFYRGRLDSPPVKGGFFFLLHP